MLVRPVDGELVILDRARGVVHQLNETAGLVWAACDGERTVRDIAGELAATFDVSVDAAERDVMAMLRQLAHLGLLEGETVEARQTGEESKHG